MIRETSLILMLAIAPVLLPCQSQSSIVIVSTITCESNHLLVDASVQCTVNTIGNSAASYSINLVVSSGDGVAALQNFSFTSASIYMSLSNLRIGHFIK